MKNSPPSHKEYEGKRLSRTLHKFQTAIGTFRFRNRSSDCNGALGNLWNAVKVLSSIHAVNSEAFLTCFLKTRIIALYFGPHCIIFFEWNAFSVDCKTAIIQPGNKFGTAAIFLPVVSVFVIAGINTGLGAFERTTIFLSCTTLIWNFTVFVHCQTSFSNRVTRC